jgi:hypothetical protein
LTNKELRDRESNEKQGEGGIEALYAKLGKKKPQSGIQSTLKLGEFIPVNWTPKREDEREPPATGEKPALYSRLPNVDH